MLCLNDLQCPALFQFYTIILLLYSIGYCIDGEAEGTSGAAETTEGQGD